MTILLGNPCNGCSARDSYCVWNCPLLYRFETTAKKFRELGKLDDIKFKSEKDFDEFFDEIYGRSDY